MVPILFTEPYVLIDKEKAAELLGKKPKYQEKGLKIRQVVLHGIRPLVMNQELKARSNLMNKFAIKTMQDELEERLESIKGPTLEQHYLVRNTLWGMNKSDPIVARREQRNTSNTRFNRTCK
jgi:hypothetical protein